MDGGKTNRKITQMMRIMVMISLRTGLPNQWYVNGSRSHLGFIKVWTNFLEVHLCLFRVLLWGKHTKTVKMGGQFAFWVQCVLPSTHSKFCMGKCWEFAVKRCQCKCFAKFMPLSADTVTRNEIKVNKAGDVSVMQKLNISVVKAWTRPVICRIYTPCIMLIHCTKKLIMQQAATTICSNPLISQFTVEWNSCNPHLQLLEGMRQQTVDSQC